jgi:hypothetical protein
MGLIERIARAMCANEGFAWENCAQCVWEQDARTALKETADYIAETYGDLHPGAVCIRSALSNG